MGVAALERAKYRKAWRLPEYRKYSPGEEMLPLFRQLARPRGRRTLVDIGCGTGRAGVALSRWYDVTLMDFADNCLDADVTLPLVQANIFGRWPPKRWEYGYCCDVMEHIPPDRIEVALTNIATHVGRCFFSIAFTPDHFGTVVGHPLHLTVKPFKWWKNVLSQHGDVLDARDLIGMGAFYLAVT